MKVHKQSDFGAYPSERENLIEVQDSMRNEYPTKIKAEMEELQKKYFSTDDDEDLEEFIQRNASERYKRFFEEKEKRDRELLDRGIIED